MPTSSKLGLLRPKYITYKWLINAKDEKTVFEYIEEHIDCIIDNAIFSDEECPISCSGILALDANKNARTFYVTMTANNKVARPYISMVSRFMRRLPDSKEPCRSLSSECSWIYGIKR